MSVWRTMSIALEADTRGFVTAMRGASDATDAFGESAARNIDSAAQAAETFAQRSRIAWEQGEQTAKSVGDLWLPASAQIDGASDALDGVTSAATGAETATKGAAGEAANLGDTAKHKIGQASEEFQTFGDRARTAWSTMKDWGRKLGGIAGGFGLVATATKALTGGWRRVTTLQDATSALEISLGDASQAAKVMDDVLRVVTGTPYNFDSFAASAQEMIGMGVEARKVPTYLEAIGEAAATQGGRAQEFADRLSTSFGQIASSGQISLRDVWSISQTGVNALAILANSFGVTRDEMKKMVSQGAVPAGAALDALAKGILHGTDGPAGATRALAGTMEKLRENMSGAVGGISSAMDRLGAALIEPFTPAIVAAAVGLADAIDDIGGAAGSAATLVAPLVEGLVSIGGGIVLTTLSEVATLITAVTGAVAGNDIAVKTIAAALATIAAIKVGSGLWALAGAIGEIVGGLVVAGQGAFDGFRLGLQGLTEQGAGASNALGGLVNTFKTTPALLGAAGGAVAVLGLAWADYQSKAQAAKKATQDLTAAVEASGDLGESFAEKLAATWAGTSGGFDTGALSMSNFRHFIEEAGYDLKSLHDALTGTNAEYNELVNALTRVPGGVAALEYTERWRKAFFDTESNIGRHKDALDDLGLSSEASFNKMVESLWSVVSLTGMSREAFDKWVAAGKNAAGAAAAIEEVDDSMAGLPPQIVAMSDAFDDLADSINNSVDRLSAWADLYDAVVGIPKAWEDAHRDWIGTIYDLEEALKESGGALDIHTEAGRENHKMVSDAIDEAFKAAEAYGEQGNGAEDAANMLAFMREQLILTIEKQVGSREEAEKLVAQYGLTEEAMWLLSAAAKDGQISASDLSGVMKYLAEKAGDAKLKIDDAGKAVVELPSGKTVTIDVLVNRLAYDRLRNDIQRDSGMSWGQITGGRWGGIYKYAAGGLHGGGRRTAQIGTGKNMIWWDEPETGGEAYIPRLGNTGRSLSVLSEAASWYGMGIVPMRDGGIRAPLATGAVTAGSGATRITRIENVYVTETDLGMTRNEFKQLAVEAVRGL